jgi:hypothetical protein
VKILFASEILNTFLITAKASALATVWEAETEAGFAVGNLESEEEALE